MSSPRPPRPLREMNAESGCTGDEVRRAAVRGMFNVCRQRFARGLLWATRHGDGDDGPRRGMMDPNHDFTANGGAGDEGGMTAAERGGAVGGGGGGGARVAGRRVPLVRAARPGGGRARRPSGPRRPATRTAGT